MAVCYNKLWKLLIDKGMKKKDLQAVTGISSGVIAKLGKNEDVTTTNVVGMRLIGAGKGQLRSICRL